MSTNVILQSDDFRGYTAEQIYIYASIENIRLRKQYRELIISISNFEHKSAFENKCKITRIGCNISNYLDWAEEKCSQKNEELLNKIKNLNEDALATVDLADKMYCSAKQHQEIH